MAGERHSVQIAWRKTALSLVRFWQPGCDTVVRSLLQQSELAVGLPKADCLEVSGLGHADLSQSPQAITCVRQFADSL
jgi:hypothetical protein